MVHGYHVIFGAYGFWLPNDPRGSWSEFVGAWQLFRFGRATKTDSRRSVAAKHHDHKKRLDAKRSLKYLAVYFTGVQARAVSRGFGEYVNKSGAIIWACSILPEHVHLVIGRHRYAVEHVVRLLKSEATLQLKKENIHPLAACSSIDGSITTPWAKRCWKVFLNQDADIRRAVHYVENNPIKENKPPQKWSFVTPFEGIV